MRARWEQILEGKRSKTPGGLYDAHIILAQRFHWDQQTVDAQDAAYVDELTVFLDALAVVEKRQQRKK
jgi:hypothetical protein